MEGFGFKLRGLGYDKWIVNILTSRRIRGMVFKKFSRVGVFRKFSILRGSGISPFSHSWPRSTDSSRGQGILWFRGIRFLHDATKIQFYGLYLTELSQDSFATNCRGQVGSGVTFPWLCLTIRNAIICWLSESWKKLGTLHDFACHPCAGAMLIFSVSFQFLYMSRRHGTTYLLHLFLYACYSFTYFIVTVFNSNIPFLTSTNFIDIKPNLTTY